MALPVTIPNTFANATSSIPLSQLDTNFSTLANAVNGLNSGSETLANLKATTANVGVLTVTGNATIGDASTDTVTLNSTLTANTAVIFAAGTSAAPSITTTGDTNTGIFFPAADTIAFAEGGAEAMRIDSDGDVGIGTTSPGYKLDVQGASGTAYLRLKETGSTTPNNLVRFEASDGLKGYVGQPGTTDLRVYSVGNVAFATGGVTSGDQKMLLDTSGNLGLGVTPSAWEAGWTPIQGGGYSLGSGNAVQMQIGSNWYNNAGYKYRGTGLAALYQQSSGVHSWYTAASGTAGNAITFTQAMTLDASGNLGIGTTSPVTKLDVRSTSFTPSSSASAVLIEDKSSWAQGLQFYINGAGLYNSSRPSGAIGAGNQGGGIWYTAGAFLSNDPGGASAFTATATSASMYRQADAAHVWYTNTSLTAGNTFTQTERARIPAAGGFQCVNSISVGNATPTTSGAGITFPATQSASSDANTLDDYEEGTFTPVLGGSGGTSGQSYSFQNGAYTKIGNRVFCHMTIKISTVGTITGNLQIQGLPFTSDSTANYQASAYCGYFETMGANQIFINGFVNTNTTNIALYKASAAAASSTAMTTTDLASDSVLIFSCNYIV